MVESADFNHGPMETPMTETTLPLIELLQKQDDGDFLRSVAEAVLQLLMEHDVEGLVGAGRYERGDGRQTWRNYQARRATGARPSGREGLRAKGR
jgi:putative transposase